MEAIYMDHNATTPMRAEVREAMSPYLNEVFGNASSIHTCGRAAAKGINWAREQVAGALGCRPEIAWPGVPACKLPPSQQAETVQERR